MNITMVCGGNEGDDSLYKVENVPYSADATVTCGFEPEAFIVVLNTPNYSSGNKWHMLAYDNSVSAGRGVCYLNSGNTVQYYAIPMATGFGIRQLTSTGFVLGYNSGLGTGQTYTVYVIKGSS